MQNNNSKYTIRSWVRSYRRKYILENPRSPITEFRNSITKQEQYLVGLSCVLHLCDLRVFYENNIKKF